MAKLSKVVLTLAIIVIISWLVVLIIDDADSGSGQATLQSTPTVFGRGIYEPDTTAVSLGEKADPNYKITFPKDHFEHTNFDIEWWYLTANLEDDKGQQYGLQWTLFRFRNPWISKTSNPVSLSSPTWHNNQVYMAHASVHSMQNHWFAEKFARGGIGNAGGSSERFDLFIDNWQWRNKNDESAMFPSMLTFSVPMIETQTDKPPSQSVLNVDVQLTRTGPFVLHGENGYSIKSGNKQHASHYYSAPFISVVGALNKAEDGHEETIKVKGTAWFDQEWTSQLLDTSATGWDWMSLHFDDGSKLMAFRMRLNDQHDYMTGSFIQANGQLTTLLPKDIRLTPLSMSSINSKSMPLEWHVGIPKFNVDITVSALKQQQWNPALVSYYEGMVVVTGTHTGKGFLELTGY